MGNDASSTIRLLSTGPVPGWLGVLLFLVLAAFVVYQHRRDFAGSDRTGLTRRTLPAVRIGIVALLAWLLCQPILLIVHHWTPPADVLLVVDSANSMSVNEYGTSVSRHLDALEAVGQRPIERRNNAAARISHVCDLMRHTSTEAILGLQSEVDAAATGLPFGPSLARKLERISHDLRGQSDALTSAQNDLPADAGDKPLKDATAQLVKSTQLIAATAESLITDAAVVGAESARSPALLDAYLGHLKGLASATEASGQKGEALQSAIDKATLASKDLDAVGTQPLTREVLANLAADRLSARREQGPEWTRQKSASLATALDDAFHRTMTSPLAGVVVLSDGSAPLPTSSSPSLDRLRMPVSTVLIGTDSVEPPDSGIVGIEAPRVALAGQRTTLRVLVKNLLATAAAPKLTVTVGKTSVASQDLPQTQNEYRAIEISWTPADVGRVQLMFKIESTLADAYPGNETACAMVEVVSTKTRVLVVSDRLSNDFAAVTQVLGSSPAIDVRSIAAAPGLARFHIGSKAEDFPGAAQDLRALSLLVLMGSPPAAVNDDIVRAIREAIDTGLRVWVQTPPSASPGKSWASVLGIDAKPIEGRQAIEPVKGLWLDLYQLGSDAESSHEQWKSLPHPGSLSEVTTPGIPLLTANGRPVLQLIQRKAGAIIASGIGDYSQLRTLATASSVNRMLYESLAIGLTPLTEPGALGGMFPAQPVLGHDAVLIGDATASKGFDPTGVPESSAGDSKWVRVIDPSAVSIQLGGKTIERAVRRPLTRQDFQLAAHAEPLKAIAKATGGRHADIYSIADVLLENLKGIPRSSSRRIDLWSGPWIPLLLLLLVSSEYLLRRRAGKVM